MKRKGKRKAKKSQKPTEVKFVINVDPNSPEAKQWSPPPTPTPRPEKPFPSDGARDLINMVPSLNRLFGITVDLSNEYIPVFTKGEMKVTMSRMALLHNGVDVVIEALKRMRHSSCLQFNVNVPDNVFVGFDTTAIRRREGELSRGSATLDYAGGDQ